METSTIYKNVTEQKITGTVKKSEKHASENSMIKKKQNWKTEKAE